MSDLLRIIENEIQLVAFLFLFVVYIFRLIWLFRFHSKKEKTYPAGRAKNGVVYSMMNIAMPWTMESTRKQKGFYVQFIIFHLGVIFAISATLIIPYWPRLFEVKAIVLVFQIIVGAAFVVGLLRLYRRLSRPDIRLVSTWDDFFSLILMTLYFAAGVLAIPNKFESSEWPLIIFFALTAFFLIYVPFSKICHYLYYPFTRFFLGRTMGHRGVICKKNSKIEEAKRAVKP